MIAVRALSKNFITDRGNIEVLKEVDLDIRTGERIAVVGASGAGKTTLMHLLGGLDRPSSGSVLFAEQDIFQYFLQNVFLVLNKFHIIYEKSYKDFFQSHKL